MPADLKVGYYCNQDIQESWVKMGEWLVDWSNIEGQSIKKVRAEDLKADFLCSSGNPGKLVKQEDW